VILMLKKTIAILSATTSALTVAAAAYAYDKSKADTAELNKFKAYTMMTFDEHSLERLDNQRRLLAIIPETSQQPHQKLKLLELNSQIEKLKRRMDRIN
jgi:hypothetical protein